jgi:hypothetical protein
LLQVSSKYIIEETDYSGLTIDFLHGIGYSLIEKNVLELNGIKRTTTAGDLLSRRRAEGNKQPDFAARLRISQAKGL